MIAEKCIPIFIQAIDDYHVKDDINSTLVMPSELNNFEALLYEKCWIDTVQWHMEDLIRKPNIDPVEGMSLKRRIDQSNQDRTDTVEKIDDFFWMKFKDNGNDKSTWNTESPGWVLDKLSILQGLPSSSGPTRGLERIHIPHGHGTWLSTSAGAGAW